MRVGGSTSRVAADRYTFCSSSAGPACDQRCSHLATELASILLQQGDMCYC